MNGKRHNHKGRIPTFSSPRHSANALLIFLPAFIFACCSKYYPETCGTVSARNTGLYLKSSPDGDTGLAGMEADVFFYNNDALGRIDSYQRLTIGQDNFLDAASRKGHKTAAVICNPQEAGYDWGAVSSLESLYGLYADLKKEKPGALLMCGIMELDTADDGRFDMDVHPLCSEIRLRSIRCDFSGRSYSGSRLENVHVYLSNINSMAKIFHSGDDMPVSPVNTDGLYHESDRTFTCPEIVHAKIREGVGSETAYPGIRLFCYPNSSTEDSAGSPFTRLVVSGEIDGKRYYYPLNINQDGYGKAEGPCGIGRNCCYTFDIVLRQTGVTDPTLPVSGEMVEIYGTVKAWDVKNENEICF